MSKRINISSNTKWEDIVGYSRAVRIGNCIEVAGTTSIEGDKIIGVNNAFEQTEYILHKIEKSLISAGAALRDVVRTRIYTTNISQWEQIGKAHGNFFSKIKPVTTMIEVKALINPEMLVEIEATAILT